MSNPEFLREGWAIEDFLHPDRIVLGGDEAGVAPRRASSTGRSSISPSPVAGETRPRLITTQLTSAEMIKYAANAFLATKISFANEIANLCELVGADARQVLPAIGADSRIGASSCPGIRLGWLLLRQGVAALVATGRGVRLYNVALARDHRGERRSAPPPSASCSGNCGCSRAVGSASSACPSSPAPTTFEMLRPWTSPAVCLVGGRRVGVRSGGQEAP